jgi:hypothetical protein
MDHESCTRRCIDNRRKILSRINVHTATLGKADKIDIRSIC